MSHFSPIYFNSSRRADTNTAEFSLTATFFLDNKRLWIFLPGSQGNFSFKEAAEQVLSRLDKVSKK